MSRMKLLSMKSTRALAFVAMLLPFVGRAQDERTPCDKPQDKKILKLLAEAEKEKNPTERHAKLKATQEIDPECTECLFQLGISAFGRARQVPAASIPVSVTSKR